MSEQQQILTQNYKTKTSDITSEQQMLRIEYLKSVLQNDYAWHKFQKRTRMKDLRSPLFYTQSAKFNEIYSLRDDENEIKLRQI